MGKTKNQIMAFVFSVFYLLSFIILIERYGKIGTIIWICGNIIFGVVLWFTVPEIRWQSKYLANEMRKKRF